jgi:hypothetical protein
MRTTDVILTMLLGLAGSASARTQSIRALHRSQQQSFVMQTNDRVVRSFLVFRVLRSDEQQQDRLQVARERDRFTLTSGRPATITSEGAYGAAVMGASVFLVAHAPGRLRPLFDGNRVVHAGPALFEGGGMGAGVGGRF